MSERILVTGVTGFLGSHVMDMLLEEGYLVRAASRGAKIPRLLEAYANFVADGRLEVLRIMDLANEQFPQLFEGVDALIHTAAPQVGRESPECMVRNTVQGTLNILRQAEKAGVTRVIITSAAVTAVNAAGAVSDQDWNPVSQDVALASRNPMVVFNACKTLAEKAVWEFADTHPHVDITTSTSSSDVEETTDSLTMRVGRCSVNPPIMYGPLAEAHKPSTPDFAALSTNVLVYRLLFPWGSYPTAADYIDVRDAARAHVLALKSPPTFIVGRKRVLIASPAHLSFEKIIQYLREKRPALQSRLTTFPAPRYDGDRLPVDYARIVDILGMKKGDFNPAEESFVESVDQLVAMESEWIQGGYRIDDRPCVRLNGGESSSLKV